MIAANGQANPCPLPAIKPTMGIINMTKEARNTTPAPLPPDPDNLNDDRAEWVASCLALMVRETGCAYGREALGDLLADMFHWCDRNGLAGEMPNIFAGAAETYRAETANDPFEENDK